MAEMLYLFEERLITKFHTQGMSSTDDVSQELSNSRILRSTFLTDSHTSHTQGPGKTAQAEAEAVRFMLVLCCFTLFYAVFMMFLYCFMLFLC